MKIIFKNKYYFENQIPSIILVVIGLAITLYFYQRNKNIVEKNNIVQTEVVNKSCNGSKRTTSIDVYFNKSIYKIKYGYNKCTKINLGDRIELYYDEKNNVLIQSEMVGQNLFQIIFLLIVFIMFLIPWKIILVD